MRPVISHAVSTPCKDKRRAYVKTFLVLAATVFVLFTVTTLSVSATEQVPNVRPGRYETVIQASMPGRGPRPPRTESKCLTADDLKDWNSLIRGVGTREDEQQGCQVVDLKVTAGNVAFTKRCANRAGTFDAKVDIRVLSGDSYEAVVKTSQGPGQANPLFQGMTITATSKRVGDCTK